MRFVSEATLILLVVFHSGTVPNIDQEYIFVLGIVFHTKNTILLGSATKTTLLTFCVPF